MLLIIMLMPERFLTRTLSNHPYGKVIAHILATAVHSVEPGAAVRRLVERQGDILVVNGQKHRLTKHGRIFILGLGKASYAMAAPVAELLADLSPHGLLIPKQRINDSIPGMKVQPGGHPVPDDNSLAAGRKAIALIENLSREDLLICLISGGGSALMTAPCEGIALADLQMLTSELLSCGARIEEINTLRRHLDRLKGGGLARLASPARVVSLILSDVIGSPLEAIASGPTCPDPSTCADAKVILEKYGLLGKCPKSIIDILEHSPETPKIGDPIFDRVQNIIVGSNKLAIESALAQASAVGFYTSALGADWQGEARQVAGKLCHILKTANDPRPFCMIAGGETTVTLNGCGRGGRNQELALAAVNDLAGIPEVMLVSFATDGEDGPTDAAGAIVTGETMRRGLEAGLSSETFLEDNDAYTFFSALGDLLMPGPSGTNVNDLMFLFGF
jgi:glycerate 2-kinase